MFENIQLSYSTYYLLFAVALAFVYAAFLYFNEKKFREAKSWLPIVLSSLRFLSVLGILFLLLNPFIKQLSEEQKDPIIVIAEDRSESLTAVTPIDTLNKINNQISTLAQSLDEKYDVDRIYFGASIREAAVDSFTDQTTNFSELVKTIDDRYSDQNLGAVIISSDGIYNEGKNPIYEELEIRAPIYTIALGDTTIKKDLYVSNLLHNRIAYYGDKFSLQVDIEAHNSVAQSSTLRVYKLSGDNRQLVDEERFNISNNHFFKTFNFELDADQVGNVTYQISVSPIAEESSTRNNSKRFYMEILDGRQKILVLANAPHPDLGAIKKLIENNKNYEVELKFTHEKLGNLADNDMIILHNLPSAKFSTAKLLKETQKRNTPILYIVGSQTSLPRFNVTQEAVKITGNNKNQNDAQAILSSNFNLYTLEDNLIKRLPEFVPLKVPFGEYQLNPKSEVLLYQKIGNVDTRYPLVFFHEQSGQKVGVISGEGIWQWNLFEYAKYEEQTANKQFFSKLIQYLSKKEDKRKFRSYTSKVNYKENENISFDAQLYNASFELVNTPDAFLEIRDANGKKYEYTFSKTSNYYKLNAGRFGEGNYNYTARSLFNGQNYSSKGSFVVQSIEKEQYDLTAKHDILYALSRKNNGALVLPQNISSLSEQLLQNNDIKPLLVVNSMTEKILNIKWLALIIAFLLFLEWFLRRFFGHY